MGDYYYPESGDGDWKKCYPTREDAEKDVVKKGDRFAYKPELLDESGGYLRKYDWYCIIDLERWMKNEANSS